MSTAAILQLINMEQRLQIKWDPIIMWFESGENWKWFYVDKILIK